MSAGQAQAPDRPAGREAVLHRLLRRLLLHVHARRLAAREAGGAVRADQHGVAVLPRRRAVRRRGALVDQLLPPVPRRDGQAALGRDPQRPRPPTPPRSPGPADHLHLSADAGRRSRDVRARECADAAVRATRSGSRGDAGQQEHPQLGADARASDAWAAPGTTRSTSRTSWPSRSRAATTTSRSARPRSSNTRTPRRASPTGRRPTRPGACPPSAGRSSTSSTRSPAWPGTRGTLPLNLGSYSDGTPVPNWYTAKADLDAAKAAGESEGLRPGDLDLQLPQPDARVPDRPDRRHQGVPQGCCCLPCSVFDAILFDNDGVLVDTEHLYFRANQEALAGVGIELDADAYVELFLREGRGAWHLARERGLGPADIEALRAARDRRYSRHGRGRRRPDPGGGRHRAGAGAALPAGDRHQLRAGAVRAHARAHRAARTLRAGAGAGRLRARQAGTRSLPARRRAPRRRAPTAAW